MLKNKLILCVTFFFMGVHIFSFSQEKKVNILVIVPEKFNDIELSTVSVMLKKAKIRTVTMGVENIKQMSYAGFPIVLDRTSDRIFAKDFDGVILLGGTTSYYYNQFVNVENLLHDFYSSGKLVAGISLAPLVLDQAGFLKKKQATIDPNISGKLSKDTIYVANKAIVDGNMITGYGPGNTSEFVKLIISYFKGVQLGDKVKTELFF